MCVIWPWSLISIVSKYLWLRVCTFAPVMWTETADFFLLSLFTIQITIIKKWIRMWKCRPQHDYSFTEKLHHTLKKVIAVTDTIIPVTCIFLIKKINYLQYRSLFVFILMLLEFAQFYGVSSESCCNLVFLLKFGIESSCSISITNIHLQLL